MNLCFLISLIVCFALPLANGFTLSRNSNQKKISAKRDGIIGFKEISTGLSLNQDYFRSSTELRMTSKDSNDKVETKYVIAGIVFLLACLFDYFRMHGGHPYWEVVN